MDKIGKSIYRALRYVGLYITGIAWGLLTLVNSKWTTLSFMLVVWAMNVLSVGFVLPIAILNFGCLAIIGYWVALLAVPVPIAVIDAVNDYKAGKIDKLGLEDALIDSTSILTGISSEETKD